jgi:methionyl-tRNA formyltransferase
LALRLVFMGTPDFAVPTLVEIVGGGHEVVAVYSRASKPAGRGMELQPTPVAREAARFDIPVSTPKTLKGDEAAAAMRAHGADAAVVVAYGLILPKQILELFPLGCFNLHASLLPRWRGAAPINRAIMAGDAHTGAMVMKMDEGLDTGSISMAERVAIGADMTAGELHDSLARLGANLVARALAALEKGALQLTPQVSPMRRRSTRPKRASTGRSHGRLCTTIAADCRRFPARGASLRELAASRFCVRPKARGQVRRALRSMAT